MKPQPDIDVVYTWVDGGRPDYMDLVRPYARSAHDLNPERFRDELGLLRYSLRSLELYAPWVRRVYLFTCRPQVPSWLRRDHPKLQLVHHDEVVSEPGILPTFNSNVIERYLDRMPGISPHFIYCNDDHLLGAPLAINDLYDAEGRMKVTGTLFGFPLRCRAYEQQLIPFGLLEHGPMLIDRELWRAMQEAEPEAFSAEHTHRFRNPKDLRCDRLFRWYALRRASDRCVAEPFWRYLRVARFHKLRNSLEREQRAFAKLDRMRPRYICLNDDQRDHPNPEVISLARDYLNRWYPQPSSFEILGA